MTALRLLLPLVLLALVPAAARADGPPVTSLDAGPDGVVALRGGDRYTALQTPRGTVLTQSRTRSGRVMRAAVLGRRWGVPVIANDGSSGGLSADGATLVLIRAAGTYPRRRTSFALVDTGPLTVRRTIALKGEWGFDALSPDGSTLYLIQQAPRDRNRYAVRAYDLRDNRLLPDPVVDPSEPDEPMRGLPVTRTTGPGGRWEYTLYAGGEHPFIHALDTVRRESVCIDLPHRVARSKRLWDLKLAVRGERIAVVNDERVVASAPRGPQQASVGGGPPWAVAALLVAGLIAAAGWRGSRRLPRVGKAHG